MIKYRKLTDLTDEEVRCFMSEILPDYKIIDISRDYEWEEINVTTESELEEADGSPVVCKDVITLSVPSGFDDGISTHDFIFTGDEITKYQKFIFAKGVDWRFKDNPYIY